MAAADSPFPGMDPYLEQPGRWRGFHLAFLAEMMAALNATLPQPYTADVEESVHLVELDTLSSRETVPDGIVTRGNSPTMASSGAATLAPGLAPVLLAHPHQQEVKERWIEIRHAPDRELVAVIEMLSPTNKGDGRQEYLSKRAALMAQPIHLIELDLLTFGKRLPMADPLPAGDYFAMVSRASDRPVAEVYAWGVRDPLPPIPVPLRAPDADHRLSLQDVFAETYRRGAYRRKLDYSKSLTTKLSADDLAWVVATARSGATA